MTGRCTLALLRQEAYFGSRSVIFAWALVAPIVISAVLALLFGSLLGDLPTLGLVDPGGSRLAAEVARTRAVETRFYSNAGDLLSAVEAGAVDVGAVLPEDVDASLQSAQPLVLETYTWGQSLARHRAVISSTLAGTAEAVAERGSPVAIELVTVGDVEEVSLRQRILPTVVLLAIFLGGLFLPATSLVREKERGTLAALMVTPAGPGDVLLSKGLFGWAASLTMGTATVVLNGAWGAGPVLLLVTLALGATFAVEVGLLLGIFLKDVTTLFAVWKTGAILLFGPAIVYLFPQIPEWIGRLFPTYYLVQPVFAVSLLGAGWSQEWDELAVLAGLVAALGVALAAMRSRLLGHSG